MNGLDQTRKVVSAVFIVVAIVILGAILASAVLSGEQLLIRFLTAVVVAALGLYVISDLRLQQTDGSAALSSAPTSSATHLTTGTNAMPLLRNRKPDDSQGPPPANSTAAFMAKIAEVDAGLSKERSPEVSPKPALKEALGEALGPEDDALAPPSVMLDPREVDDTTVGTRINISPPSFAHSGVISTSAEENSMSTTLDDQHGETLRAEDYLDEPNFSYFLRPSKWGSDLEGGEEETDNQSHAKNDSQSEVGDESGVDGWQPMERTTDRSHQSGDNAYFFNRGSASDDDDLAASEEVPTTEEVAAPSEVAASHETHLEVSDSELDIPQTEATETPALDADLVEHPPSMAGDGTRVIHIDRSKIPTSRDSTDTEVEGPEIQDPESEGAESEGTDNQALGARRVDASDVDTERLKPTRLRSITQPADDSTDDIEHREMVTKTVRTTLDRSTPNQETQSQLAAGSPPAQVVPEETALAIQSAIREGETKIISSLTNQGILTGSGPITDADVTTMVYVAFTSTELKKLLLAGGSIDGDNSQVDLGEIEIYTSNQPEFEDTYLVSGPEEVVENLEARAANS